MTCKIVQKNQPKTVVVVVGQQKHNKQLEFTGDDGNGASKSLARE